MISTDIYIIIYN